MMPARNASPARSAASAAGWHSDARLQRCCISGRQAGNDTMFNYQLSIKN
jgi:hypothetical protein